jgi:hypothetical protein
MMRDDGSQAADDGYADRQPMQGLQRKCPRDNENAELAPAGDDG